MAGGRWPGTGRGSLFGYEPAYFLAVVGKDAVAAPDLSTREAVHKAPGPTPGAFEGRDPAFGASPPLDELAEPGAPFDAATGCALAAFPYYGYELHPQRRQLVLDPGLAVASVGGDRPRCPAGYGLYPLDRRGERGPSGGLPT